jgi:hypothetical protein
MTMKFNVMLLVAVLAFATLGCAPKQTLPNPKPLPAGTTFTGVWYSPQFEHMYVRQIGNEVRGIYTYKYGGTLEGELDGNLLKFKWIDPGNKDEARRGARGQGYLQLVTEGESLKLVGEWGYDEARTGGGPWEADYVRELEPEDPRSLEQWKEAGMVDG